MNSFCDSLCEDTSDCVSHRSEMLQVGMWGRKRDRLRRPIAESGEHYSSLTLLIPGTRSPT